MSGILTLAIKDLRLLFRDKLGLFFIIGFPVIMGVFFGLIAGSMGSDRDTNMSIGIADLDDSVMSHRFVEKLGEQKGIKIRNVERSEASELVRKGSIVAFIAIPAGFGNTAGIMWLEGPALEMGIDPSRQAEGGMLQGFVMRAMGSLVQDRFSDPGSMREQIKNVMPDFDSEASMPAEQRETLKSLWGSVDEFLGSMDEYQGKLGSGGGATAGGPRMELARIDTVDVTRDLNDQEKLIRKLRSRWDISFPSAMMWGIMGCVAGFAISMVKERTGGTMLRLTVAPISRTQILAGKGVACFLSATGVIVFMMVLGKLMGIQLVSPVLLVLAILSVSSCFVGLMMLMSVIGKTEQAVGGAGWAIITILCMFGGGMIPLAFMPSWMQTVSNFSPVKWGILALEGAIWRGLSFREMLLPCGVLLGIGAVTFAAGVTILSRDEL